MVMSAVTPYIAGAAIAAIGLGGWWAYSSGVDAGDAKCRAEYTERTEKLQGRIDLLSAARREAETALAQADQERVELERKLSDEANDDPMADHPGLGLDSLRRLDRAGRPPEDTD